VFLTGGRVSGVVTVNKSEFDSPMASTSHFGYSGTLCPDFHFYHVSCLSALASLQASRKCNKIKGCVLSSRSEEEKQKGCCPCAWLKTAFQKVSRQCQQTKSPAEISRPSWLNWAPPLKKKKKKGGGAAGGTEA
jgi:hypothetical protein